MKIGFGSYPLGACNVVEEKYTQIANYSRSAFRGISEDLQEEGVILSGQREMGSKVKNARKTLKEIWTKNCRMLCIYQGQKGTWISLN